MSIEENKRKTNNSFFTVSLMFVISAAIMAAKIALINSH